MTGMPGRMPGYVVAITYTDAGGRRQIAAVAPDADSARAFIVALPVATFRISGGWQARVQVAYQLGPVVGGGKTKADALAVGESGRLGAFQLEFVPMVEEAA